MAAARVLRAPGLWLGAVLVLGAALRIAGIGAGLWYDEIVTLVRYVRLPLAEIVTTFDSQNQHPLYSVLAHLGFAAYHEGTAVLRFPAAAFGVLSLWAVWWFAKRITTSLEGVLAALILAVSYHHIWFSQNARGYTILMFAALTSTALLVDLLTGQARWRLHGAAYAIVTGLALYTNITAGFVVTAHALVWLALLVLGRLTPAARWHAPVAIAAGVALALLCYAPALGPMLETVTRPSMAGTAIEWKQPAWLLREMGRGLARGVPGGLVTVGAGFAVLGAGVWSFGRREPAALALMLLPIVVTAFAMVATSHNLWPRLFFFAAGFVVLLAVRGGFELARLVMPRKATKLGTLGCCIVAAASLTTVPAAWRPKQDFVNAREYVTDAAVAGDAVAVVDLARFPFESWMNTGWTVVESDSALASLEETHRRVWVLYTFPTRLRAVHPELWSRLRGDYQEAARFTGSVGDGDVVVLMHQ